MTLHIDLPKEQERAVRDLAQRRGVPVEEIAREAIVAYTSRIDDEAFHRHAQASVRANSDLLKRLA